MPILSSDIQFEDFLHFLQKHVHHVRCVHHQKHGPAGEHSPPLRSSRFVFFALPFPLYLVPQGPVSINVQVACVAQVAGPEKGTCIVGGICARGGEMMHRCVQWVHRIQVRFLPFSPCSRPHTLSCPLATTLLRSPFFFRSFRPATSFATLPLSDTLAFPPSLPPPLRSLYTPATHFLLFISSACARSRFALAN